MIKNKKAILFDLDGTLVESMWVWRDIDVLYLQELGEEMPENLQREIEGMSFKETAQYFKTRFHIPDSIESIQEHWLAMAKEQYEHEIPLKKGAREFLQYLHTNGYKVAICSSNNMNLICSVLKAHQIEKYIQQIHTCNEVAKGKPAPDIYLKAAHDLGVAPCDCLVFEDIVPGIMAGKNANMATCAVEDDYSSSQREEKKQTADYYIQDYFDILDCL